MPSMRFMQEHHAYLQLMLDLSGPLAESFDVVHNHSLHYLPVAMASAVPAPVLSTLHTPPTPWLESALAVRSGAGAHFAAVSRHTAAAWQHAVDDIEVVPNGVDLDSWPEGRGGQHLIWFGRLVPEKGAHVAVDAARRAGFPIVLAGPISDAEYFDRMIRPRLGSEVTYLGHLAQPELAAAIGGAAATLVAPVGRTVRAGGRGIVGVRNACGGVRPRWDPRSAHPRLRQSRRRGGRPCPGPGDPGRRRALACGGARPRQGMLLRAQDGRHVRRPVPATGAGPHPTPGAGEGRTVIGYYIHHHGHGHRMRASSISAQLQSPVTTLSSAPPPPAGRFADSIALARDDRGSDPVNPTADGALHWAPTHDTGLRTRMARIVSWIDATRPDLVVVDVSVEVAALVRLLGVPVVLIAMPGERTDAPHHLGYQLADHIIAAWPQNLYDPGGCASSPTRRPSWAGSAGSRDAPSPLPTGPGRPASSYSAGRAERP